MNIATAPASPSDPNSPQVVFPSPYRLSAEDEKGLIDYAFQRLDELEKELGRDKCRANDWWTGNGGTDSINQGKKSFLGKRQVYELLYENEVDWRIDVFGEIFAQSNFHLPVTRRVVTQQVARANAHFYGSDPWFFADVVLSDDENLQVSAERYVRNKFADGGIKAALESANERAFVRGECVMKRAHRVESDIYDAELEIMVTAQGEPIFDSVGEYVTRSTPVTVIPAAVAPLEEEVPTVQRVFSRKKPAPPRGDVMALADGTVIPGDHRFEMRIVPRRQTLYQGPHLEECYFKDILIPLTARDVDSADIVAHLYEIPVADLADQWNRASLGIGASEAERNIRTEEAVAAIQAMQGNTDGRQESIEMGAGSTYRVERPEDAYADDNAVTAARPDTATAKVVEFWLKYDANKDGVMENIILVVDRETRRPIRYDYVSNVTPDGKRPFSVIRVNPVNGRWYGVGSMQIYEQIQNIIDLLLNRWNVSSGKSGRIDFVNREAIKGKETDPDMEINWGELYELMPGFTAQDAFSSINLPEVKAADLKNMIDLFMQMAMNMSGVQHANDAGQAGLQSAKTATSIINLDKSGQEMFGQLLSHLEDGIIPTANALAEITIVNMPERDMFHWEQDDKARYDTIERATIGDARLSLRLTLSKFKAEQEKLDLGTLIAMAEKFFMIADPVARNAMVPLYRQFARHHGAKNPELIFTEISQSPAPPAYHGLPGQTDPEVNVLAPPSDATPPADNRQPEPNQYSAQMASGQQGGLQAVEQRAAVTP